ncbi:unnamed protein product [Euphydryas editha]|uniref:Uncharacterized protein n=1 Tax=Euphydryas editha TaxID=104508 RepID=A0AAU9TM09_EUPED|nr:unnamed protein product [Euphydryas editha]
MTDESEAGRRARSPPAPPPRPSVRPEPRPRTLPPAPRLIRPSEHLAMVEQARERERRPPPLVPSVTVVQGPSAFQGPKMVQGGSLQQRPSIVQGEPLLHRPSMVQGGPLLQGPPKVQGPAMPGPRPPPPPQVPRPYVPPPTRMPAPVTKAHPVTRLPQPRRDIQTLSRIAEFKVELLAPNSPRFSMAGLLIYMSRIFTEINRFPHKFFFTAENEILNTKSYRC